MNAERARGGAANLQPWHSMKSTKIAKSQGIVLVPKLRQQISCPNRSVQPELSR